MSQGRHIIILTLALLLATPTRAQRFCISTNMAEWARIVTPNLGFQYAPGRHISLEIQAAYSNWRYDLPNDRFTMAKERPRETETSLIRQRAYVGLRIWPWNVYSGWWIGIGAQMQLFENYHIKYCVMDNQGGKAEGLVLSSGYSLQVHKHWNVDFGLGLWGGLYWTQDRIDYRKNYGLFLENTTLTVGVSYIF